jgi:hypothetical protein
MAMGGMKRLGAGLWSLRSVLRASCGIRLAMESANHEKAFKSDGQT